MSNFTYGLQPNVTAQELAFSIYTDVDAAFFDVEYPEHDWYKILREDQINNNINPGATTYAARIRDRQGTAAFVGKNENNNIPKVSQTIGAFEVPMAASAVGATLNNEDARQYQFGFNSNLAQDLGECMRVACDNLIEQTTFFGDPSVGFRGFLNYSDITVTNAANGAAGTATWATKTGLEMVKDVNNAISYMWETSRSLFVADTVFLPLAQYSLLSNTPMALSSQASTFVSALTYLKANNLCSQIRGKDLEVVPIRYLKGAGVGSADRMVLQDRSKRNQGMPFPLPYTVQAPVPVPLGAEFYSEQKHGSYYISQKQSTLYVDGI